MNQQNELTFNDMSLAESAIDLTFDGTIISEDEKQSNVPENLRPTPAMQNRFIENCIEKGVLVKR